MPFRGLIGQGLITVAMVSMAAMIVVAFLARGENSGAVITAILGFAASTIAGVMAVLNKMEAIEDRLVQADNMVDKLYQSVDRHNGQLAKVDDTCEQGLRHVRDIASSLHGTQIRIVELQKSVDEFRGPKRDP